MRVVMPGKVLVVRPVPPTSTGPSVREMVLGSEGRLGVITEVTVQVHRIPEVRVIFHEPRHARSIQRCPSSPWFVPSKSSNVDKWIIQDSAYGAALVLSARFLTRASSGRAQVGEGTQLIVV
jgi:hypothetical protein